MQRQFLYWFLGICSLSTPFTSCMAQNTLEAHLWQDRVLLIFAKAKHTAWHREQMDQLLADTSGLRERDLVIYQVFPQGGTGPQGTALDSTLRARIQKQYAPEYPDFRFILIGKDGTVKWQTDRVADRAELFSRIDRMPMRRAEMKNKG